MMERIVDVFVTQPTDPVHNTLLLPSYLYFNRCQYDNTYLLSQRIPLHFTYNLLYFVLNVSMLNCCSIRDFGRTQVKRTLLCERCENKPTGHGHRLVWEFPRQPLPLTCLAIKWSKWLTGYAQIENEFLELCESYEN